MGDVTVFLKSTLYGVIIIVFAMIQLRFVAFSWFSVLQQHQTEFGSKIRCSNFSFSECCGTRHVGLTVKV